ncbi:MAG: proline--tRNA ligase [Kiritimatiellae bacterium]|nr:proline--tRNA ligase [Kiritimatiellia bacterium]
MHWSKQMIPTLRDVPQEAEIPSHQLMLRAGLIRKLSAGLYTFLPLGLKALKNVEQIVREEMDRAGALEVLMPALQTQDLWERSGRFGVMEEVMFKMNDRQNRLMVLGPTHEEVITELVAREISSYRQLPKNFYQIQNKFRDEIRPRFGLMRVKEFIMKDAYSFDVDTKAAEVSYQAMYAAYEHIFKRCGLRTTAVEADTGAMGGKASHEFMVVADAGEDGLVQCNQCTYAANVEQAESKGSPEPLSENDNRPLEEVATVNLRTIEEVAQFLKVPESRLIKTLIYSVDDKPVAVLVPGNRDVNEVKLARVLQAENLQLANDETVKKVTGASVGFAGGVGLSIPVYADLNLEGYKGAVIGGNKRDTHLLHVDIARDIQVTVYTDISFSKDKDSCPRCEGVLHEKRGIEVGHVFKLGTAYSKKLGAMYLDTHGKQQPTVMGCYGIGISRTLQAVIEQRHDKDGIQWPISLAPYPIQVLVLNPQHAESVEVAERLISDLTGIGVEVLYDDRDERPGVKFKDADLIGIPIRVSVGKRSCGKGVLEIKCREEKDVHEIKTANALDYLKTMIEKLNQALKPI